MCAPRATSITVAVSLSNGMIACPPLVLVEAVVDSAEAVARVVLEAEVDLGSVLHRRRFTKSQLLWFCSVVGKKNDLR
jgi:hypothetical protein